MAVRLEVKDVDDLAKTLRSMLSTIEMMLKRIETLETEVKYLKGFSIGIDSRVGQVEDRFQTFLEVNNLWDGS